MLNASFHRMNGLTTSVTVLLGWVIFFYPGWSQAEEPEIPGFKHSVETREKPWTHTRFLNNPDHFQFAIVSDRTGGVRRGIFPRAVRKLNELQPEFVMSVGDLITGGAKQKKESVLLKQWQEFNSFIKGFDMPFFYLPGNHDVSNEVGDRVWDKLYGVRYYSFVYKDVLFLCLNTQEGPGWRPPSLGNEQVKWAAAELAVSAEPKPQPTSSNALKAALRKETSSLPSCAAMSLA